jgi:hypothetical protein
MRRVNTNIRIREGITFLGIRKYCFSDYLANIMGGGGALLV